MKLLFTALIILSSTAFGQYRTILGDKVSGMSGYQNFAKNPSCQNGISYISSSVGAPVVAKDTTIKVDTATGTSCKIDATGSGQTWSFDLGKIPVELKGGNCQVAFKHSGAPLLYKAYVTINSVKVSSEVVPVDSSSYVKEEILAFPCGDDTTNAAYLVFESTSASAAQLNMAKISLSENRNIGTVAQAKARVQAARITSTQAIASTAYTTVIFNDDSTSASSLYDYYSEYDTSTGIFTAKENMVAKISGSAFLSAVNSGEGFILAVQKNGGAYPCYGYKIAGFTTDLVALTGCDVPMVAGDTLRLQVKSGADTSYNVVNDIATILTISSLPTQSEQVLRMGLEDYNFTATRSSTTTLAPNGSIVDIVFNSAVYNPSGAYNATTGEYTAKVSGLHWFRTSINLLATNVLANDYEAYIRKNGSTPIAAGHFNPFVTAAKGLLRTAETAYIYLNAGDTVKPSLYGAGNNSASQVTISADVSASYFTGGPVGNVAKSVLVKQSVVSPYDGVLNTLSYNAVCAGASSINNQLGGSAVTISNISAGICNITFPAGTFSAPPNCQLTTVACAAPTGVRCFALLNNAVATTSGYSSFGISDAGGTSTSYTTNVTCMGPR